MRESGEVLLKYSYYKSMHTVLSSMHSTLVLLEFELVLVVVLL